MGRNLLLALAMLALPVVAFLGGAWALERWSGRESVAPAGQAPLHRRWSYDAEAVRGYWSAFPDGGLARERLFLELDLVFPFLYGGALAAALLLGWAGLGRPFHPAWVLAPVLGGVLADWTENLVLLGQLRRHLRGAALQEGWIRLASTATAAKLLLLGGSFLLLLVLAVAVVVRGRSPAS